LLEKFPAGIRSDGKIKGYNRGTKKKRSLLSKEGCDMVKNIKIEH